MHFILIKIMEDPIAVPITKLEQDKYGNPKDFSLVVKEMLEGNDGKIKIENVVFN